MIGQSRRRRTENSLTAIAYSHQAVAGTVISLGQKLNMRVIAEGVETGDQVAFLLKNNCDEMQGYHFSKPVSAQDIENLLNAPGNS